MRRSQPFARGYRVDTKRAMDDERVRELEKKIEDLQSRLPAHSIPPRMIEELEDLEEELEAARAAAKDA